MIDPFLYGLYTEKNLDLDEFPNYIDKYFPECDGIALMEVLKMSLGEKASVVEIGGWKGRSTAIVANSVAKKNGIVYIVNSVDYLLSNIYSVFRENMIKLGLWPVIRLMLMEPTIAAGIFRDRFLNMVFIDDIHEYSSMKDNINSWLPKLKEGGILCGHDGGTYCSKIADMLIEDQMLLEYRDKSKDIRSLGYPGVIKALHDCLGDKYSVMTDSSIWYYVKSYER